MDKPLDDVWKRIEQWLHANAPRIATDLSPGASDTAFAALKKQFKAELPLEMVDSYRIHDGARGAAAPLFGDWRLLPLAAIGKERKTIATVTDEETLEEVEDTTDPRIKGEWWSQHWIPVASNGAGDYLCVDLDPAPAGTRGQIIAFYHAKTGRELIATGFAQWLADFAADLERGAYRVESGWLVRN